MFLMALVIASMILITGCASIIHGNKQEVYFSSKPLGAKIIIDGQGYGLTPRTIALNRKCRSKGEGKEKDKYNVVIHLEGYQPYELVITREVDEWFYGNILIGGLIGFIIDAASGSMYKLTTDQVKPFLRKNRSAYHYQQNNLFIAVTLDIDPEWEKIGELSLK